MSIHKKIGMISFPDLETVVCFVLLLGELEDAPFIEIYFDHGARVWRAYLIAD